MPGAGGPKLVISHVSRHFDFFTISDAELCLTLQVSSTACQQ
jgi:hypothetical protein